MKKNSATWVSCQKLFYDSGIKNADRKPIVLYKSPTLQEFGHDLKYESMYNMLCDPESSLEYLAEYDVYMNLNDLQIITGDTNITAATFTSNFKKLFPDAKIVRMSNNNNKNYVLVNFEGDKLKIRRK